jgi:serine/threonine-protein kinase RsbW
MTTSPAQETPLVRLQVLADHRYLNVVSACLAAFLERVDAIAERGTVTYNVQLAVHEACANIVEHAYNGQVGGWIEIEIFLVDAPRRLIVDLFDEGGLFDASQESKPNLDEPQNHGYGLFLVRALVDDVQYERVKNRNHWRLSKKL